MTNQYSLPDYNDDGSMNPHVRDRFLAKGFSEQEIQEIEELSIRHAAVEKEQAYWKEQHKKDREEWRKKKRSRKKKNKRDWE